MIGTGASAVQLLPGIVDQVGRSRCTSAPRTGRPAEQRADQPRGAGGDQGQLRRARRAGPLDVRRLRPSRRHPGHLRGHQGTALGVLRGALEPAWLRQAVQQLQRHAGRPQGQRRVLRVPRREDPRARDDPATAEKLIPKDHGYGMKRPPMETGYYEAYNLPNLKLVDLHETPIERITETGIVTSEGEEQFDVIIWATGFDAVTGALTRMGLVGTGDSGSRSCGPRTPHLPRGPHPALPEPAVRRWAPLPLRERPPRHRGPGRLRDRAGRARDRARLRPGRAPRAAEEEWTEHVLRPPARSSWPTRWFRGANIPGKADRFLLYWAGSSTPGQARRGGHQRLRGVPAGGRAGHGQDSVRPAPHLRAAAWAGLPMVAGGSLGRSPRARRVASSWGMPTSCRLTGMPSARPQGTRGRGRPG